MLVVKPDAANGESEIKALNCQKDGVPAGFVKFRQYGYIIDVIDIAPNPLDPNEIKGEMYTVLDTIIRALASYALNHSCFYLESKSGSIFPTLEKLRFHFEDGIMKSNLQSLLSPCK